MRHNLLNTLRRCVATIGLTVGCMFCVVGTMIVLQRGDMQLAGLYGCCAAVGFSVAVRALADGRQC